MVEVSPSVSTHPRPGALALPWGITRTVKKDFEGLISAQDCDGAAGRTQAKTSPGRGKELPSRTRFTWSVTIILAFASN